MSIIMVLIDFYLFNNYVSIWGELPGGISEQTIYETFWSIQVTAGFAVMADIQYLKNPVGNPDEDVWELGVRTRLTY